MSDETVEQKSDREIATTEGHVKGVEEAADKGLLNRRQAERVINVGQKAIRGQDLTRGLNQRGE